MVTGIRMRTRIRMFGRSEKARVIQPDGQVRQVELPVSVGDLLRLHPHHCVRDATNRRLKSKASIMPIEAQLESGGIYLLLHLPRLFPSSSSAPPLLPPCICFLKDNQEQEPEEEEEKRAKFGPAKWMGKRHQYGLLLFTSCFAQACKVSPEGIGLGLGLERSIRNGMMKRSRIWEPSLERIVENEILYPQSSSRKAGELVQERKPANKRIEQRVSNQSSSSCKSNSRPGSSSSSKLSLRRKKRDADANVISL